MSLISLIKSLFVNSAEPVDPDLDQLTSIIIDNISTCERPISDYEATKILSQKPILADLDWFKRQNDVVGEEYSELNREKRIVETKVYIATVHRDVTAYDLEKYEFVFEKHLGKPKKERGQEVIPGKTVPLEFIEYLNQMDAFTFGGTAHRMGYKPFEEIVAALASQQGGCTNPPIDIFNTQSFYGRIDTHPRTTRVQIVRILPHVSSEKQKFTVDYLYMHTYSQAHLMLAENTY
jgi:hypothetical protein